MVLFLVSLILAIFPFHSAIRRAYAANACVWTGAVNSNWDTAGNWTTCGGVAPTAIDSVTFNSSYSVAANINSASTVTIAGLAIDTGYTATITQSQIINVNGDLSQVAGTFSGSTAAITITGNFTLSGGTFTSTSGTLSVGGSWSRTAGTFTHNSGTVTFTSTATGKTVTAGGQSFANLTFGGVGGGWTFQDAITATGTITLTNGSLNTNGQTISAAAIASSNTNTRSLTLGASNITLTIGGSNYAWNMGTTTGLTFSAGTSTITMTGNNLSRYNGFNGGGKTYNNISFSGSGSPGVHGANVITNLTKTGAAVKGDGLVFNGNQTITGTLTVNGNSATNRVLVSSYITGTTRIISAAAVSVSNADFTDITGAGAASWNLSATTGGSGNALGNSGITFTTAASQYWVGNGGGWSDVNHWASTSGGTGGTGRVPLPQDTAYINASSITSASQTITLDVPRLGGNIDYTGVANSPTVSHAATTTMYGSLTYASGLGSINGTYYSFSLSSRSTAAITSGGKTFNGILIINGPGGTFNLQDSLTIGTTFYIYNGTFNASTFNVSAPTIDIARYGSVRTVNMGSGTWTASGTSSAWYMGTGGTTTLDAGTSTIVMSDASATAKVFDGAGKTYYDFSVNSAGSATYTFTGANSFHNFTVTGAAKTVTLPASTTTTITNSFDINGTASYTVTLNSSSSGTAATLSKTSGTVSVDYLSIRDITAAGGATWYAGANSTSVSGNTGWIFTAPPTIDYYWVGGDGSWSSASHWASSSGGAGGVGTPSITDSVIFDINSAAAAVTVDASISVGGLSLTADFSGSISQGTSTIAVGSSNYSQAGGTLTGGSAAITINGNFTLSGGAFSSTSGTLSVSGNWSRTAGSFTHNSGTVAFTSTASGKTITVGSQTFSGLTFNGSGGNWALQDTLTVASNLTVTAGTLNANNQNIALAGNLTIANGAGFTKGSGTLTLNGASQNLSDANATTNDLGAVATSGTGTATLTGNLSVTTMSIGNGTTLNLGTSSYTLTLTGTGTPITTNTSGTFSKGTGSTVNYAGSGTTTNVVALVYNSLSFSPSSATTYNLTGNLTSGNALSGNLTIGSNATLDATASNYNIALAGNWSNSGTFTAQNTTVTLSGTNQTISGNTTFYNLTKQVASAYTLTFTASTTQTVTGTLTLNGIAGQLLSLRSSSNGTSWNLALSGTGAVTYSDVRDSNLTGNSITPTSCSNSGNNSALWLFPINVGVSAATSGSCIASSTSLSSILVGNCLTFGGSATGATLYQWDFDGNGTYEWSNTTSANTTHVMPIVGSFTSRMRATMADGSKLYADIAQPIVVSTRDPDSYPNTDIIQLEKLIGQNGNYLSAGQNGSWEGSNGRGDVSHSLVVSPDGSYAIYAYITPGSRYAGADHQVPELHIAQSGESPGDPWTDIKLMSAPYYTTEYWDSHFDPTVAIDDQGYIHVIGGMHNEPWNYWRSISPNTIGTSINDLEKLGADQSPVHDQPSYLSLYGSQFYKYTSSILPGSQTSYPRLFQDDSGKLYLTWRGRQTDWQRSFPPFSPGTDRRTPEGLTAMASYNSTTRMWEYVPEPVGDNAYRNAFGATASDIASDLGLAALGMSSDQITRTVDIGAQIVRDFSYSVGGSLMSIEPQSAPNSGRIHMIWGWGDFMRSWNGKSHSNDLSYARSDDDGKSWQKSDGTTYSLPIKHGQAEIIVPRTNNGDFYYSPAAGNIANDSFNVTVDDDEHVSAPATITINFASNATTPVANNQGLTTAKNTPVNITLTGYDPNGDTMTYTRTSSPSHGTLSGSATGTITGRFAPDFTYTPAANYTDPAGDSFTFTVSANGETSSPATITIKTVEPGGTTPVAFSQTVTTKQDTGAYIRNYGSYNPDSGNLVYRIVLGQPFYQHNGINTAYGTLRYLYEDESSGDGRRREEIPVHGIEPPEIDSGGNIYQYFFNESFPAGQRARLIKFDAASQEWQEEQVLPNSNINDGIVGPTNIIERVKLGVANYVSADGYNSSVQGGLGFYSGQVDWGVPSATELIRERWQFNRYGRRSYVLLGALTTGRDIWFARRSCDDINCTAINRKPVLAEVGGQATAIASPTSVTLRGSDLDGDALTYSATGLPTGATFDANTKIFSWTPSAGQVGNHIVTFSVTDGTYTDSEEVTFTASGDHTPSANAQSVSLSQDTDTNITLTGYDALGHNLSYTIASQPTNGALSGIAPNITYTPTASYFGSDSFTFTVNDGTTTSDPATVSITVAEAGNTTPVANAQSVTTNEDVAKAITLTGFDLDSDPLTYTVVSQPANGTLTGSAPDLTYTPGAGYFGSDSFTFTVNDGTATSTAATVSITVVEVAPGNNAPSANAQSVTTNKNTAKAITLTGSDPDSNPLTYAIVAQPTHGTLSGATPDITYTPTTNYVGSDSFTFTVNDGTVNSSAATVSITVASTNAAPLANDQSVTTNKNLAKAITLTGFDSDSDALTYTVVTQPTRGALTGTVPNLTYTPEDNYSSTDSFTFKVNDGTVDSGTATVSITIVNINNTPAATAQSASVNQDIDLVLTLAGTDADGGDTLTYSLVSQPSHGTLSTLSGTSVTYTPASRYTGSDSFAFRVNDGNIDSAYAVVSITVINTNHAPIASSQSVTVSQDSTTGITLTGSDGDADTLTYTITSSPAHGTLSGDAPDLTYTPTAGYSGSDSFTFTVYDGQENSTSAGTVTVTVSAVPITSGTTEDTTATGGNVDSVISKATGGVIAQAKAAAAKAAIEEGGVTVSGAAKKLRRASAGSSETSAATRAAVALAVTVGLGGGAAGIVWLFRPQLLAALFRRF